MMATKDLKVEMFWLSELEELVYYPQSILVNDWLSKNSDREIERIDYPDGGNGNGCILVIWHRKIDFDFQNRREPESK